MYRAELYKRAQEKIGALGIDGKFIMTCPKCWQDTFIWFQGNDHCYLCGHEEHVTVCQECGLIMFENEAHKIYYRKWMRRDKKEYIDRYPDLCDSCLEDYVFDEDVQIA